MLNRAAMLMPLMKIQTNHMMLVCGRSTTTTGVVARVERLPATKTITLTAQRRYMHGVVTPGSSGALAPNAAAAILPKDI